jgi:ComEC/Rec2-related protein
MSRMADDMERWKDMLAAWCRRQPLMVPTVLLIGGIVCGYRWGCGVAAGTCAVVCASAWAVSERVRMAVRVSAFAAVVLFFAGWVLAALDRAGRMEEARRVGGGEEARTFVCRVGPEVSVKAMKGRASKVSFDAEAVRFEGDDGGVLRRLPVAVAWFGAAERAPRPGEVWELQGRAKIRQQRGSGLLSLEINSGERAGRRLKEADAAAWKVRVDWARREAARRVAIGIEDWGDIPALNQAMLLGARRDMPPAMRKVFIDSGTIHVFAISGMHIVLVAAVLTLLVATLGVPRTHWLLVVGPPLVFYTVLTGAQPSAVRACLMGLLYFLGPFVGRRPNGWAALAGAALIVHVVKPSLIYNVGSVLSFACMGGLLAFCGTFCKIGRRWFGVGGLEERATLARASGSAAQARYWDARAAVAKWTADAFAVSFAAFLASVPLTAYYFGRFTPGGLFANLVICPCSLLIVVAGLLGMAASCVSDGLASCFNHAAGGVTWVMVKTTELTAVCPGSNYYVEKWPPWMVLAWYGALLVFAVWLHGRKQGGDGLEWMEGDGK